MAVYTKVGDKELSDFLQSYDLGKLVSMTGIEEGVENSNYRLRTEGGDFILTLFERRVRREDLPFFLDLMAHLALLNVVCPVPIRNRRGEMLDELCDRPAAIVTFLPGRPVEQIDENACILVGEALGRLHEAGSSFKGERENDLSLEGWRKLVHSCRRPDADADLLSRLEAMLNRLDSCWPRDLRRGIIHADMFPDNLFFMDGRVTGIIDFYFSCCDLLAYDLAVCLNAWCRKGDGQLHEAHAGALYTGYESVRVMDRKEHEAMPILLAGAALRFALTRLADLTSSRPGALVKLKDPAEYIRILDWVCL